MKITNVADHENRTRPQKNMQMTVKITIKLASTLPSLHTVCFSGMKVAQVLPYVVAYKNQQAIDIVHVMRIFYLTLHEANTRW